MSTGTDVDFSSLEHALGETMLADRHRLARQLRAMNDARRTGKPFDRNLARFQQELDESRLRFRSRRERRPAIEYDEILPVVQRRAEIAQAIRDHQVVVLCGETGSGKSTQLPKICLELGRGVAGMIGHTQPRRIAARSVASRVAEELRTSLGREVGFKVRFTDATSPQTMIKLLTDGMLLAETQTDRWLNQYDTLIIDEAHERSLNIDFLLGYIHRLLPQRPDLKLIITSATIDASRFADHFATVAAVPSRVAGAGALREAPVIVGANSGASPKVAPAPATRGQEVAGNVPVLEVSGRTYPVEIRYRPPAEDDEEADLFRLIADAVQEAAAEGPGDVLVFLPTERDIHDAAKVLRGRNFGGGKAEILPLYARLSIQEQQRVFQPSSGRRIVLATNVAESSLTVPGIRYVVDPGTARISVYSPRTKLQRLPIERVSQASANQRAGRCGRVGPGVCIRLYSADDYLQREQFTPPEILRSNLASVILQTECLGLGHVHEFPFLEPPKSEAIRDGYKTLFELGAVDAENRLTELGRSLHRLPVDPRIGRIILAGIDEGCLSEVLVIAAALEAQDPRDRPLEKQQQADEAHAKFEDADSDFVTYLRLWDFYHGLKNDLTKGQLRKACQQNFLSFVRLKEWTDLHRELVEVVQEFVADQRGFPSGGREPPGSGGSGRITHNQGAHAPRSVDKEGVMQRSPPLPNPLPRGGGEGTRRMIVHAAYHWPAEGLSAEKYAAVHRALLTGFLSGIAQRTETGEYQVAGGMKSWLWPGSGLAAKQPKWLVFAEAVETTRRFLRTAARIDPAWIEPLAGELVNRTYSDPQWDAEQLAVLAQERVTLWGLPIVPRRRVRYVKINPAETRELFLRHGLLAGEWPEPPQFLAHNLALAKQIEERQARLRQPALLRDDDERLEFYARQIPADVFDGRQLVDWTRQHPAQARGLFMTEADLLEPAATPASADLYPDVLEFHGLKLPLKYQHDPGGENDGVTVTVPQAGLNQLTAARLGWLVPGLLEEKVTALLKTLPKEFRRELSPIPESAKEIAPRLPFGVSELTESLSRWLEQERQLKVSPADFDASRIPEHLRMQIEVVQADGKVAAKGRDLAALQQKLGAAASTTFAAIDDTAWNRDGITTWNFGALPDVVRLERFGVMLPGYPTLIDEGSSVSLRLWDAPEKAAYELRFGVRRLFALGLARELKAQVDHLPHLNAWVLLAKTFPQPCPLREHLADLIVERACLSGGNIPRNAGDFGVGLAEAKRRLSSAVPEVVLAVRPIFDAMTQVRRQWEKVKHPQFQPSLVDAHDQLARLLAPGFLVRTPWNWLLHLPRYLQAVVRRLEKLTGGGHVRDQQQLPGLRLRWQRGFERLAQHQQRQIYDPALETYRWMLEEYRVLLFAQELGTSQPVSEKRLDKQWEAVRL